MKEKNTNNNPLNKIVVIIPTYNERKNIGFLMNSLQEECENNDAI